MSSHEKYYEHVIGMTSESQNTLYVSLVDFFTERIFMHSRSKLLQYVPLFFFGNSDKSLNASVKSFPMSAISECKTFAQLMMSRLICIALPLKGEAAPNWIAGDDEMEDTEK